MKERIDRLFRYGISLLAGLMILYLLLLSLFSTSVLGKFSYFGASGGMEMNSEHTFYLSDRFWLQLVIWLIFVTVVYVIR